MCVCVCVGGGYRSAVCPILRWALRSIRCLFCVFSFCLFSPHGYQAPAKKKRVQPSLMQMWKKYDPTAAKYPQVVVPTLCCCASLHSFVFEVG